MERRYFLKTLIASTGAMVTAGNFSCQSSMQNGQIIAQGKMPRKLWVIQIPAKMDWHKKIFLTNFQGLINRKQTRFYVLNKNPDKFWLDYYHDQFAVDYELVKNEDEIVSRFANEISGFIMYEPEMEHSLNIATALGALQNAVPISKDLETYAKRLGLKKVEDLAGKWEDMYQAYEWAIDHLIPLCNQKIMAQLCVHYPHWPTRSYGNRDYVIAHKIFPFDISSSERDKRDYVLLKKIYQAYPEGALVLGWHCVRDKEHEAIALSAEFGHYGMCTLHTHNLTVHSSIQHEKDITYKQRSINKQELTVENKTYIAFMASDGDATWFVQNLIDTDWANQAHGTFKYNWGFLPLAYDLMPGMVRYYFKNMHANDYFVAGPAGATYTYPHLHPNPKKFFRLSNHYMNKCGLTTVHVTNWNDRDWWQEVELAGYHDNLRNNLPDCIGYARGMGESAFERHYLTGGQPFIFIGEGIHRGNDIYQTMKDFIDACPNRPLFIFNLVNHTIPMDQIKKAMDRFPNASIELVHFDELLLLIEKAYEQGKIAEDLYPHKEGLKKILAREAKQAWPLFLKDLRELRSLYDEGEETYIERLCHTPIGLENLNAGDFLAFATIWHAMNLVKLSLEAQGIYVNHKPTAVNKFLVEFEHLPDVSVISELQLIWQSWHNKTVSFNHAAELANRLAALSEHINKQYFFTGRG